MLSFLHKGNGHCINLRFLQSTASATQGSRFYGTQATYKHNRHQELSTCAASQAHQAPLIFSEQTTGRSHQMAAKIVNESTQQNNGTSKKLTAQINKELLSIN